MNGYFQIQINEEGVSLLLSPPIGEGDKIRVSELKEYLDRSEEHTSELQSPA